MAAQLQGDEHDLYRRHHERLVSALRRHLQLDEQEADEAAQRAWLLLLEKQPGRKNAFGWLYTTAKHEAFASRRRLRREQPVERLDDRAGEEDDLAGQVDRAELGRRLAFVFAGWLTRNQRAALSLWAQGYSYREIAADLGKSYTWTDRHIREGLRVLRAAFGWDAESAEQLRREAMRNPLVVQARRSLPRNDR
jgi:RNA polymerase sigma factor (sigma-70 family)